MSETQNQNSPMMSPSDRVESDMTITVEEKKLVRKLIQVLVKMVPEDDIELPPTPRGQTPRDHESAVVAKLGEGFRQFKNLCENHNQLTNQIRNSLNALGGGSRAAKALQAMDDSFKAVSDAIDVGDKRVYFFPERCVPGLNKACVTVTEVMDSFKELGVFNTAFFDSFRSQLKNTADKLDLEYGLVTWWCEVDEYVDSLWEPLASDFDKFIKELATVAEKEIASIRQTQEFTSQRYLNLTTVATFLSSVTATTLQISANNPVSVITAVTNTLWFISLVFSAASAVYSLLLMTWRQSSVRRPDLSLPFLANVWLRNAPMYSLIAALSVFSIGLCLLAFLVVEKQGGPASAAIPTAFAGFHAYVIFLLSGWFLFEQWRNKHEQQCMKVNDTYLMSSISTARGLTNRINETARGLRRFSSVIKKLWLELVPSLNRNDESDIEPGQDAPLVTATDECEKPSSGEAGEVVDTTKSSKTEDELATFEIVTSPGNESKRMETDLVSEKQNEYGPVQHLLQFSSDGRYLISSILDCVTIYNVYHNFDIKSTRKVPGVGIVKQIALNRINDLLLVTTRLVFVWNLDRENYDNKPLVKFDEAVVRVRWVDEDDDTRGFVCAGGVSVKIYDKSGKELHSYDISKMHRFERILDVGLFRMKYIFVLVTLPKGGTELLAFNRETKSIERTFKDDRKSTSIVSTPMSDVVLAYGPTMARTFEFDSAVEGELSLIDSIPFDLEDKFGCGVRYTQTLTPYGNGYGMVIRHLSGQIKCLSLLDFDQRHLFTTLDADAIVKNPVGFAVAPAGSTNPYLFAILDKDGFVTLWSVQSNTNLAGSYKARDFEIHDRWNGRSGPVTVTKGRCLKLPLPENSEACGCSSAKHL